MIDLLIAREERANHLNRLSKEYQNNPIVILKLNTPGENKNLTSLLFVHYLFHEIILNEFKTKIIKSTKIKSLDGDYFYYVIKMDPLKVKEKTVFLEENHPLGKLVDLDVYLETAISRTSLNYQNRKCLICDNDAIICTRSKAHSLEDVLNKITEITKAYLLEDIYNKTLNAFYSELDLYPKFGLVSKENNGAHQDMDYQMFINSFNAIKPFLKEFILVGLNDIDNPKNLQEIGKRAEEAMFKATNNVNTIKGLIFLLGIFLPVISKAILNYQKIPDISLEIKRISEEIIGDYYLSLEKKELKTHGDIIYIKNHKKGIRGEALNGLKNIFIIPPFSTYSRKNQMMEYFIQLMSLIDDTTIIHKTNLQTLNEVKKTMQELVDNGGYLNNINKVEKLSQEYLERNISPGGASDMLVIKILFESLAKEYELR